MVCSIRQASRSAVWGSTPAATSWRVKNSVFRRSARLPPGLYRSSAGRSLHPSSGSRLFSRSYRMAYAGLGLPHVLGYIHGAHHLFLFLEYQHSLQVVLAGRMKFHGVPPLQFPGLCHFFFFPHFPIKRYLLQHLPMCTAT